MSKPLPNPHHTPPAAATPQQLPASPAKTATAAVAAAAQNLGQELNNEVAAMINAPSSPAVRRSVVQLDTVQPSHLSLRPPSFAFVAAEGRRSSQPTVAPPDEKDDEFSSEYSNPSERDPTEAFEQDGDDGFKICKRPPDPTKCDDRENCDTENCDMKPKSEEGPVWIIPPEADKPKKKKNKKKKRVEKDT